MGGDWKVEESIVVFARIVFCKIKTSVKTPF